MDPRENPRADWLGVRTVQGGEERASPNLRDRAMERASTEEPLPPALPLVLKIADPRAVPEGAGARAPEMLSAEVESSSAAQGLGPLQGVTPAPAEEPAPITSLGAEATAAPAPPERGEAIALEYADDSVLAGRPRLGNDGSVRPPGPKRGEPARYGPDPTYPAAYYAGGSAPTAVPKNREVWPVSRPWRPTLLPRVWRRLREAVAGTAAPASSAVGEPHNIAQPGQGVERVVADRLDEPTER